MKRRDFFLTGIACTLAARPLVAQQRARVPHVGILNYAADGRYPRAPIPGRNRRLGLR